MLNPILYRALVSRFGKVQVLNEDVQRVERYDPRSRTYSVTERGENYQMCCPFCDDARFRLTVSYRYLSRDTGLCAENRRRSELINCYNEGCRQLHEERFQKDMLRRIADAEAGALLDDQVVQPVVKAPTVNARRDLGLPGNAVLLRSLRQRHPARAFLRSQYPGVPEEYLLSYNLLYCSEPDPRYRLSGERVIFPIFGVNGQVVSWQGRTIHSDVNPRWYNPPGFSKEHLFNLYNVSPVDRVEICEGIPNAIACGPRAIAVYGSRLTPKVVQLLANRYTHARLVFDPDTFVPDNRPGGKGRVAMEYVRTQLSKHMQVDVVQWPDDVLAAARAYCNGETQRKPPDAADIGLVRMQRILNGAT